MGRDVAFHEGNYNMDSRVTRNIPQNSRFYRDVKKRVTSQIALKSSNICFMIGFFKVAHNHCCVIVGIVPEVIFLSPILFTESPLTRLILPLF